MNPLILLTTVLVGVLAVAGQTAAATAIDSQVTEIGEHFVAGVNSDSLQERLSTVRRIYAASSLRDIGEERLAGFFDRVRGDYGKLKHHHSELVGTYVHLYALSVRDSMWHDFQFQLQLEPVLRLIRIVFIAEVTEPVYLPNGNIDDPFTLSWLADYVDKLSNENDLAAGLLLARGDSIFFERYVGYADASRTRAVDSLTRFNLGSGNKMFTAIAIMQLRDAGKLSLTDTLAQFFPDFPNKEFISAATIHHLLSHTSGLGDFWDENYERSWDSITQINQMLPFVYDDSISFGPGAAFQYSNSGYILAGLIVEKVSGLNYFDYVRDHICTPLGMLNTDSYLRTGTTHELAEPLARSDHGWKVARHGKRGSSAGGGYSTPRDMLRFMRGLTNGKILDQPSLDGMTAPKNTGLEDNYPYGYGFTLRLKEKRVVSFGHGGIAPGVNFEIQYYPAEDLTLVLFSNQDNGAYDDLRKNIVKLITGDR